MPVINELLLPKILDISKKAAQNLNNGLEEILGLIGKFEDDLNRSTNAREKDETPLQISDEDDDESNNAADTMEVTTTHNDNNTAQCSDNVKGRSSMEAGPVNAKKSTEGQRASKKCSKAEVEEMASPGLDKRLKRNASMRARINISKQDNKGRSSMEAGPVNAKKSTEGQRASKKCSKAEVEEMASPGLDKRLKRNASMRARINISKQDNKGRSSMEAGPVNAKKSTEGQRASKKCSKAEVEEMASPGLDKRLKRNASMRARINISKQDNKGRSSMEAGPVNAKKSTEGQRASKKCSKAEVEEMASPGLDKRLKRNASMRARINISKQVNENLTQNKRRADSRARRGTDKETEQPSLLVQIKQEKISLSPAPEPMEAEPSARAFMRELSVGSAMPPPAAAIPNESNKAADTMEVTTTHNDNNTAQCSDNVKGGSSMEAGPVNAKKSTEGQRAPKKCSKAEVEEMASPGLDKRLKRKASMRARINISKQVNENLTQNKRRADSRARRGTDKETEQPSLLVQIKQEKISLSPAPEPMEAEPSARAFKRELSVGSAMPPPAAAVPRRRRAPQKQRFEDSSEDGGNSRRRAAAPSPAPSAGSTGNSARQTNTLVTEEQPTPPSTPALEPTPAQSRLNRTGVRRKLLKPQSSNKSEDESRLQENTIGSRDEKPAPMRTRRGQKAAEKDLQVQNCVTSKEEPAPQPEPLPSPVLQGDLKPAKNKKLKTTKTKGKSEVVEQQPAFQEMDSQTETTLTVDGARVTIDKMDVTFTLDRTMVLTDGVCYHFLVTSPSVKDHVNNATVVLEQVSRDSSPLIKPHHSVMNATVVLEKDTDGNLTQEESLLADDNSGAKRTSPAPPTMREEKMAAVRDAAERGGRPAAVAEARAHAGLDNTEWLRELERKDHVNNATVVLEQVSRDSSPLIKPHHSVMNATVVLDKDTDGNLTQEESLLADDNSGAKRTSPAPPTMREEKMAAVRDAAERGGRPAAVAEARAHAGLDNTEWLRELERKDHVNNATVVLEQVSRDSSPLIKPHHSVMNATVVLDKDTDGNLTQEESLLADDNSGAKRTSPAPPTMREEKMAAGRDAAERGGRPAAGAEARAHAGLGNSEWLQELEKLKLELTRKIAETEERRRAEELARWQLWEAEGSKKESSMMAEEIVNKLKEYIEKEDETMHTPRAPPEPVHMRDGFQHLHSDDEEQPQPQPMPWCPAWSTPELKLELTRKIAETEERRRAEELARWQLWEAEGSKKESSMMAEEIVNKLKEYIEKEDETMHTPRAPPEPVHMRDGFQHLHSDDEEQPQPMPWCPAWSTPEALTAALLLQDHVRPAIFELWFDEPADSPDLLDIFPDIERSRLHRTASAVWRTPPAAAQPLAE